MSEITPPVPSATYDFPPSVPVYVYAPVRRRYWLHALLLLATVFTTLIVGARLQYNFNHDLPAFSLESLASMFPVVWVWRQPSRILLGIPFSATLLSILLAHEFGHYLYCVRYRIQATLPFFIPAPTLIGTFGAFIRIRSPIRSRSALFDIGVAGPIAGFVLAVPALAIALCFSKPMPVGAQFSDVDFGLPLIFSLVQHVVGRVSPAMVWHSPLNSLYLHPTAIAAWVGMFATAMNLLPSGQLDGGHIVYALAPASHRLLSRVTLLVLLPLAWFRWEGWLLLFLLLAVTRARHPQVATSPGLGTGRCMLAVFALVMLIATFMPAPVDHYSLQDLLRAGLTR